MARRTGFNETNFTELFNLITYTPSSMELDKQVDSFFSEKTSYYVGITRYPNISLMNDCAQAAFRRAAAECNFVVMQYFLNSKNSVIAPLTISKMGALFGLVRSNKVSFVHLLLSHIDEDLNKFVDESNLTLFANALDFKDVKEDSFNDRLQIIDLLAKKMDLKELCKTQDLLMTAISYSGGNKKIPIAIRTAIVEILLKAGVKVSSLTSEYKHLVTAAYNGYNQICRLLLEHKANPNEISLKSGASPLWHTVSAVNSDAEFKFPDGNLELASLLLSAGASPNIILTNPNTKVSRTPLQWAIACNKEKLISLFLNPPTPTLSASSTTTSTHSESKASIAALTSLPRAAASSLSLGTSINEIKSTTVVSQADAKVEPAAPAASSSSPFQAVGLPSTSSMSLFSSSSAPLPAAVSEPALPLFPLIFAPAELVPLLQRNQQGEAQPKQARFF